MIPCDFELGHHHRLVSAVADTGAVGPRTQGQAKGVALN